MNRNKNAFISYFGQIYIKIWTLFTKRNKFVFRVHKEKH